MSNPRFPMEIVVHYFLTGGMACLGHCNEFLIVSLHVCMATQTYDESWRKTIKLSWFTKLLYFIDSQPWGNIELISKSIEGFDL